MAITTTTSHPPTSTFTLFTSLRYDPVLLSSPENHSEHLSFSRTGSPLYMLRHHRDRLLEAARHFRWPAAAQERLADGAALERDILARVRAYQAEQQVADGPLRVRVQLHPTGDLTIDIAPTPGVPLSALYPSTFTLPSSPQSPAAAPPVTWHIHLDPHPTSPSSFTTHKTTHRNPYDAARQRCIPSGGSRGTEGGAGGSIAGPTPASEVLLHNPLGEITEGSLTTPYFYRGGRWVTPPVGPPVLPAPAPAQSPPPQAQALGEQGEEGGEGEGKTLLDEAEPPSFFPGRWGHSLRDDTVTVGEGGGAGGGGQRGTTRRWALARGLCVEETVSRASVRSGEVVWLSNGVRGFGVGRVV